MLEERQADKKSGADNKQFPHWNVPKKLNLRSEKILNIKGENIKEKYSHHFPKFGCLNSVVAVPTFTISKSASNTE